jgi:starch synthase
MRILLASSEVHPFSKTGGLADMAAALAKYLARAGHQVGLVTPLYRGIRERFPKVQPFDWQIDLPLGSGRVQAKVWSAGGAGEPTIYFIDQPEFYQRTGLYQHAGADYPDNAARFIFLSKCVAQMARYLPWQPELVHVHDWQVGLVPLMIRHQQWREGWGTAPRTCLTIHNLAYQGVFFPSDFALTNLPPDYLTLHGAEAYGMLNCLKAAIVFADRITTVSPRYAREILTEQFGYGLDGVLRSRQSVLTGILNGVDTHEWNTRNNPHLKHTYDVRHLAGKRAQKLDVQQELGLPASEGTPLFGTITRLADQKGVDILLGALEEMLAADMQFMLLGSGDPYFEKAYSALSRRHPSKVAAKIGFDQSLSHRIEAGCDFYLMPSRFEPCGLNQMYSLLYGTIPIVRRTGGLDDSVVDLTEDPALANGIKFTEYSARALAKAVRKALVLYADKTLMRRYRVNAMHADFSWQRTAAEYVRFYQQVLA